MLHWLAGGSKGQAQPTIKGLFVHKHKALIRSREIVSSHLVREGNVGPENDHIFAITVIVNSMGTLAESKVKLNKVKVVLVFELLRYILFEIYLGIVMHCHFLVLFLIPLSVMMG